MLLASNGSWFANVLTVALLAPVVGAAQNVTTHHYDNFRTGWDWQETALTQSNVNPTNFALRATVLFDQQVDAQPLVLNNQSINGTVHSTVVYIATENNSVYAVDGLSGMILAQTHLETAAPISAIGNGSCNNNAAVIGINSTPVIDPGAATLYVVTATIQTAGMVTFHLHALSISTLADKVTPLTITPPLNGSGSSRQRAALTLFNGGVLIPFTSFCDNAPSMLGFITYANMNVTPAVQTFFQTSYTNLDSIWMSGGGAAVNGNSIYFLTGNGRTGPTLPPATELPHSMVLLTGSSGPPLSLAYSSSVVPDPSLIGGGDQDYGSGGVLVVPSGSPTSIGTGTGASFVVGAGKTGWLYAFRPALGIGSLFQSLSIGPCWCGESYFTGSDGIGRVVTSGGTTLRLNTVNSSTGILTPSTSVQLPAKASGNAGVWTTVSSNSTAAGTGIIWTVSGPDSNDYLHLYAYNADNLSLLFSTLAGIWDNTGGGANTIPVVSNGHVYVASDSRMTIWGLTAGPLPPPVASIGADFQTVCPRAQVTWTASPGATFYQLYVEANPLPWIPNFGGLVYTGAALQHNVPVNVGQTTLFDVAACNAFGCSALSGQPAAGSRPSICP